jgi:hypothetical protein
MIHRGGSRESLRDLFDRGGPVRSVAGARGAKVAERPSDSQRVFVKASYQSLHNKTGKSKARNHLHYLGREGQERPDEKDGQARSRFFGRDGARDKAAFLKSMETRQWRFIVSPEEAERLDLREWARDFMHCVEQDLRCELDWIAIDHYGTDQPHLHFVVNGVDADGREVRIQPHYLSHGMRRRAEFVATQHLGLRQTRRFRDAALERAESRDYTDLDRILEVDAEFVETERNGPDDLLVDVRPSSEISRAVTSAFSVDDQYDELRSSPRPPLAARKKRLRYLAGLGFAREVERDIWRVDGRFKQKLFELARRATLDRHFELLGIEPDESAYEPLAPGRSFKGEVVDVGLADEHRDRIYVLLENEDGAFCWADLGKIDPHQKPGVGERVTVTRNIEWTIRPRKSHRNLVQSSHDGVYSEDTHRAWAEANLGLSASELDDYCEAHRTALIELATHGLAEPLGDGCWRIEPDLLARIDELNRERTPDDLLPSEQWQPYRIERHGRIWEQVRADGPTEIDAILRRSALRGAEAAEAVLDPLEKALRGRARRLQSFGLADFDEDTGEVELADETKIARELPVRVALDETYGRRDVDFGLADGDLMLATLLERRDADRGPGFLICATHDGRLVCVDDYVKGELDSGDVLSVRSSASGFIQVDRLDQTTHTSEGPCPLDRFVGGEVALDDEAPAALVDAVGRRRAWLEERNIWSHRDERPAIFFADLLAREAGRIASRPTVYRPQTDEHALATFIGRVHTRDGKRLSVLDSHDGRRFLVDDYSKRGKVSEGDPVELTVSSSAGRDAFVSVAPLDVDLDVFHDAAAPCPIDRFLADADDLGEGRHLAKLLDQRRDILARTGLSAPSPAREKEWMRFRLQQGLAAEGRELSLEIEPAAGEHVVAELVDRMRSPDGQRNLVVDTHDGRRMLVPNYSRKGQLQDGALLEVQMTGRDDKPYVDVRTLALDELDEPGRPSRLDRFVSAPSHADISTRLKNLLDRRRTCLEEAGLAPPSVARGEQWAHFRLRQSLCDDPHVEVVLDPSPPVWCAGQIHERLRAPDGQRHLVVDTLDDRRLVVPDYSKRGELEVGDFVDCALSRTHEGDTFYRIEPCRADELDQTLGQHPLDLHCDARHRTGSLAPELRALHNERLRTLDADMTRRSPFERWLHRQHQRLNIERRAERFVASPPRSVSGPCEVVCRQHAPDGRRVCIVESLRGTRLALEDRWPSDAFSEAQLAYLHIDAEQTTLRRLSQNERDVELSDVHLLDQYIAEPPETELAPALQTALNHRRAYLAELGLDPDGGGTRDELYAAILAHTDPATRDCTTAGTLEQLPEDDFSIRGTVARRVRLPDGRRWCAVRTSEGALICLPDFGKRDAFDVGDELVVDITWHDRETPYLDYIDPTDRGAREALAPARDNTPTHKQER